MNSKFPYYRQPDAKDCGPTCLRMLAKFYGKNYSLQTLRKLSEISIEGVSVLGLTKAAEEIGFKVIACKIDWETLLSNAPFPCIIHWKKNHFVVLTDANRKKVKIADPAIGLISCPIDEFINNWVPSPNNSDSIKKGFALLLEPIDEFYLRECDKEVSISLSTLIRYVLPYRKYFVLIFLGILLGLFFQLIFPYLTKSIVDIGIANRDLRFIYIILIGQLTIFFGRMSIDLIRNWILLHISSRINITLVSDFFIKLTRLPLYYFDSKSSGDIIQRVNDQSRIEQFLTTSTFNFLFSALSFIVLSAVLLTYSILVCVIFIIFSVMYCVWVLYFLKKRRAIDYKRFEVNSDKSTAVIQMIAGMHDIKINNIEKEKRWELERILIRIFSIAKRSLMIDQYQMSGAFFINELKNIFITFVAARLVISGSISLGVMLAIQYIMGQLNSPLEQFVSFAKSIQDAQISLERINELNAEQDEILANKSYIEVLPFDNSIHINDLTFAYPGAGNPLVLKSLSLIIPKGKTTAIVGMSGSGKTTLLKLLLQFYPVSGGSIRIGNHNLENFNPNVWRDNVGVVLQDGFIFSDTIARNIALKQQNFNAEQMRYAAKVANIEEFITSLPMAYETKIGIEGMGLSQGQRQRILIARAVYKNPQYIFFDEATNSLDANNEKIILSQLNDFFSGRTVVIVAHRLSTVKNADQIVVLDKGQIIEYGNHQYLTKKKANYYELVRNQLELGN